MAVQVIEQFQDSPNNKSAQSRANGHGEIPPLQAGDFLTRTEFERRYHAMPHLKKAELIEGIVYMPSPVRARQHGDPHFTVINWLGSYAAHTPGIQGSDNATLRLDLLNEPQPDALLRLDPAYGGRAVIDVEGYLQGAPELIIEIAASSASYDLHQKKDVYVRHGIQEYLVFLALEQHARWFALRDDTYEPLIPRDDGILRSEVFPGLWLQPSAIWTNDLTTILSVLQQGLRSPEHVAFVEKLHATAKRD